MNGYEERMQRVMTAVGCKEEPDRVPFVPSLSNFFAMHYNISIKDFMTDCRKLIPAIMQALKDFDFDMVSGIGGYPIPPMEILGFNNARWPGEYYGLPDDTIYQFVDKTFLDEDDYDLYLKDPSDYLLTKAIPDRYDNLQGLRNLHVVNLMGQNIMSMAPFADPNVRQALKNLLDAGEKLQEYFQGSGEAAKAVIEAGYPVYGKAACFCPFDEFAHNVRGLINTCVDMLTDPELLMEAVTRWGDISIPAAIAKAKGMKQDFAFVPLHCGAEEFMSLDNYQKYYWPHLKRLIEALVGADITPIIVCEGKYQSRLETITDVPRGKVMYMFENVDLKVAKRTLEGIACVAGGMPTQLLLKGGNKETVRDQVKRIMDDCAPGGGFIMSNTLGLDNVEHDLMLEWKEATFEYGRY